MTTYRWHHKLTYDRQVSCADIHHGGSIRRSLIYWISKVFRFFKIYEFRVTDSVALTVGYLRKGMLVY